MFPPSFFSFDTLLLVLKTFLLSSMNVRKNGHFAWNRGQHSEIKLSSSRTWKKLVFSVQNWKVKQFDFLSPNVSPLTSLLVTFISVFDFILYLSSACPHLSSISTSTSAILHLQVFIFPPSSLIPASISINSTPVSTIAYKHVLWQLRKILHLPML